MTISRSKNLKMVQGGRGRYETPHRRALYDSCFNEPISVSRGTPYDCLQSHIDDCEFLPDKRPHGKRSPDRATNELVFFLDPDASISSKVWDSIERLQEGLTRDWKPDLIIKAFYDLDVVFFDGKLHGLTTLNWRSFQWWNEAFSSLDGYRRIEGRTKYLGNGKVAIDLNAWTILLDNPNAKKSIWNVVLHEMIHAYLCVMCGDITPDSYDRSRGWTDGHGWNFRHLIHSVHDRAMLHLNMPVIYENLDQYGEEERYRV